MISELKVLLSERKCDDDIVPLLTHITKTTEESIYSFVKSKGINYDIALELIIRMGLSDKYLWDSNLK